MNSLRLIKISVLHPTKIVKRSFFFCKKKPKEYHYVIERARPEDQDEILALMTRAYYPQEPLVSSIALQSNPTIERDVRAKLNEGFSLLARCKYNREILGVCINHTVNPWCAETMDKTACQAVCTKNRQALHFYALIQRSPDLFKKYHVRNILKLGNLFVKRNERRKGIGFRLLAASRELGADCGFPIIKVDATSYYMYDMCERLDMKAVSSIPYCSFVGSDMKPIFEPPCPHTAVKVYVDDRPQCHALQYHKLNKNK